MGKKEELVFSTKEEKEKYIEYINDKYGTDEINVLKETKKIIKNMNFREKENLEQTEKICLVTFFVMLLTLGPFILAGPLVDEVALIASIKSIGNIPGWLILVLGLGSLELFPVLFFPKYKGILSTILSIVGAPFILLSVLGDTINMKKVYEKKIAKAKAAKIVPATIEEDKNKSVNQYVSDFKKTRNNNYIHDIVTRIECIEESIEFLEDKEKRELYMIKLLEICNSFDKTGKLTGERKESFNEFIIEQLDNLKSLIIIDFEYHEDPEAKKRIDELVNNIKFKPYFSNLGMASLNEFGIKK